MAKTFNSTSNNKILNNAGRPAETFYAVYDSCITNNLPSHDEAFIEQRCVSGNISEQTSFDEKHFLSLREAKSYVNEHFNSGAQYFSLNQTEDPDNLFLIIIDKITYLTT